VNENYVQSCSWCIFPACSSFLGAVAEGAGYSPLAAAFSLGSPAALTLSHLACSPCGQSAEKRQKKHDGITFCTHLVMNLLI